MRKEPNNPTCPLRVTAETLRYLEPSELAAVGGRGSNITNDASSKITSADGGRPPPTTDAVARIHRHGV